MSARSAVVPGDLCSPLPWSLVLRRLPAQVRRAIAGRDLPLHAAAITFYAALAIVPLLLVVGWLASVAIGEQPVAHLVVELDRAIPDTLGADKVAGGLLGHAVHLGWQSALLATLPATLYGEGLRRAYVSFTGTSDRLVGWRGRLTVLPLLVVAPALLLGVLAVTPLLNDLLGRGVGRTILGVYLALNVDWIAISVPLAWSFRVVAPDALPIGVAIVGGLATGAFVSGFLQGFVLFLALPIDLGAPFGGLVPVGAVSAVLLWMWVLHMVVLIGFVATRQAARLRALHPPNGRAAVGADSAVDEVRKAPKGVSDSALP